MTNINFKAVRTVYMENGKSKETVKIYQTYAQAKAYAKRYSKITASKATSRQKFINVSIYINTDSFKYRNVDIYTIDSNEFEIEHLEQIEKFKMDNQETVEKEAPKYLVKGMNGFEFETHDLQKAKEVMYNNSFCFENKDIEFAIIQLKEDGSWGKVLIEGTSSKDHDRIAEFIFCSEHTAEEQAQATETEQEKEYKIHFLRTGRYGKNFKGTKTEAIKHANEIAKKHNYSWSWAIAIREIIPNGNNIFITAINWNDSYRITNGSYSEIIDSKKEAMEKAEELANKEKKAVNVYVTTLNSNGYPFTELMDTIKPFKSQTYEINGRDFTLETEDEAVILAKAIANDKNRTVRINRNGVEIAEVKPERKYKFVSSDEETEKTFEGIDAEEQAIAYGEKMANNRAIEVYEVCLGDKDRFIKSVEPKQETAEEPTEKVVGFRVGLGGKIYRTEAEAFKNNPKDAKQVFKVVDNGDGLTWEYVPIEKPAPHIKTMQEWEDSRKPFTSFCQVGELVDEEIVRYFINVLPPETWRKDLVQFGEPYGHVENPKTGGYEATYITFAKNDNGQWYYAGICFKNQREAIA